jgi:hypothetical protein
MRLLSRGPMIKTYKYKRPDDTEWGTIHALRERSAAEEAVNILNSDREFVQPNGDCFLLVKEEGAFKEQLYKVFAEPIINYYAEKVDRIECKWCRADCQYMIRDGFSMYDERFCNQRCYQSWRNNYMREINEGKK